MDALDTAGDADHRPVKQSERRHHATCHLAEFPRLPRPRVRRADAVEQPRVGGELDHRAAVVGEARGIVMRDHTSRMLGHLEHPGVDAGLGADARGVAGDGPDDGRSVEQPGDLAGRLLEHRELGQPLTGRVESVLLAPVGVDDGADVADDQAHPDRAAVGVVSGRTPHRGGERPASPGLDDGLPGREHLAAGAPVEDLIETAAALPVEEDGDGQAVDGLVAEAEHA